MIDPAVLDEFLKTDGEGRNILVQRIHYLVARLKVAEKRVSEAGLEGCLTCSGGREYKAMLANLTETQRRCTGLLEEIRTMRAGINLPGWWCSCGAFCGAEKENLTHCRACGAERPICARGSSTSQALGPNNTSALAP